MESLSLAELDRRAHEFDQAVASTPAIDHFCSSTAWVLPAATALMPARRSWILRGDAGWFAGMLGRHPSGMVYVEPLELAWGLASPLAGADAPALAAELAAHVAREREWDVLLVPGLPHDGPLLPALLEALPPRWERRWGQSTVRHLASLDGGVDGFLARRSRNFRKALRASLRDAADAGVSFVDVRAGTAAEADALYQRILAVEERSWKARDGVGITSGPMRTFYGHMLPRLCAHGQQRTWFARANDRDVGYILGAVFEAEYRGLQFSYDEEHAGLGIGGLLQYRQVAALCDERVARYDLGTEMDYKRRWAEEVMETEMLVLVR